MRYWILVALLFVLAGCGVRTHGTDEAAYDSLANLPYAAPETLPAARPASTCPEAMPTSESTDPEGGVPFFCNY